MHEGKISISEKVVAYELRRYKGQRHVNMHIRGDGLLVTAPRRMSLTAIESVLRKNSTWIGKNVSDVKARTQSTISPVVYRHLREYLRGLISARLAHFNEFYGYQFKSVSVRNQRSRWGSCSSKGSLSFNVHMIALTPRLRDYIIVHELCHTKEMNHSASFWGLVGQQIPDYKACRKELNQLKMFHR